MPLADFVRYLNAQHPVHFSGDESAPSFAFKDGSVHAHYAGLRLESVFLPILGLAGEAAWGHAARLRVTRLQTHLPLQEEVLFATPRDDAEFIYLDRLIRTLHVLNYLTYLDWRSRKTLLLKVHPRHVASVAGDHGLAFENILRGCGLMPRQIVLAFELNPDSPRSATLQAFENYRGRGYSIAIQQPTPEIVASGRLAEVDPEIVILDATTPGVLDRIKGLQGLGAAVLVAAPDDPGLQAEIRQAGADLLQRMPVAARLKYADAANAGSPDAVLPAAVGF